MAMSISKIQLAKNWNTWVIRICNYNNSTLNLHNPRLCKKGGDLRPIGPHLVN